VGVGLCRNIHAAQLLSRRAWIEARTRRPRESAASRCARRDHGRWQEALRDSVRRSSRSRNIAFEIMLGDPRAERWGSAFRDGLPLVGSLAVSGRSHRTATTSARRAIIGSAAAFNASRYQALVSGSFARSTKREASPRAMAVFSMSQGTGFSCRPRFSRD